jgi:hypothetical protein
MRSRRMRYRARLVHGRRRHPALLSGATAAPRAPGHLYRLRGIEEWLVDGPGCYLTPDANAAGRRRLRRTPDGHH